MKGFKLPTISIPKVTIPNISINISGGTTIDPSAIKSKIESAIPDLKGVTEGLDPQRIASSLLDEKMAEGIELPSELQGLLK